MFFSLCANLVNHNLYLYCHLSDGEERGSGREGTKDDNIGLLNNEDSDNNDDEDDQDEGSGKFLTPAGSAC